MKKIIIINLLLTGFLIAAQTQKLKAQENKEQRASHQSMMDLSPEEKEMRLAGMRANNKVNYDTYFSKINSLKEASKVWNEYFDYAGKQGSDIMSAHGSWSNFACDSIAHAVGQATAMGRMHCVRTDPANANIVYAGSPFGGLWKSNDGGNSWACLTDGLPRIGVADIAINPLNPNEIYIMTGDGDTDDNRGLSPCIGVLKSTNGGFTWQSTGLMFVNETGLNFNDSTKLFGRKLIMSPFNPSVLYAVTSDGIYKTSDGGINWPKIYPSVEIWDINFKPGFDTVIYASGTTSFYKSVNAGASWNSKFIDGGGRRIAMSTTIAATANVYLLVSLGSEKARFYLSTNSADTFILKADTPNVVSGQTTLDIAVEASPSNGSTVFAGVLNFYKSTNSGMNFTVKTQGAWGLSNFVHVDIHDIEIRSGIIYVASDGGIYKSTDGGTTWEEKNNGLSVAWVTGVGHAPAFPDLYYFSSFDNGLYKRTSGSSCQALAFNDGMAMVSDFTDQNTAYGNLNFDFWKTTNGGANWSLLSPPTAFAEGLLAIDPNNHNTLYLASNGIFKSTNAGNSWISLNADSSAGRSCLAIGTSNSNYIYSATRPNPNNPGIFPNNFQRYNGSSWSSCMGIDLPSNWHYWFCPSDIVVDPNDHLHVWVTFLGYQKLNKVFETFNGGADWFNRTGTIPNVAVNCIAFGPGNSNSVYIGTDIGVFYRDNSFNDWVPFLNGLPRTIISDLSIDAVSNTIVAGTCGRGLWQSDLFSSCPPSLVFAGAPFNTQYGYHFYETSNTIESDRYIEGNYGNNIIYKAGSSVNFVPGFEVIAGAEVVAKIGTCSGMPLAIPLSGNYEGDQDFKLSPTGENQLKKSPEVGLNIYPEPHTDFINMEFVSVNDLPVTIIIADILGHTIETIIKNENFASRKHSFQISTAHHKSGMYAITFTQGKNVFTKKILKL